MPETLTRHLKQAAQRLGFALVGVCPAGDTRGFPQLVEWLERGYAGQMSYLADRRDAYRHPNSVLDGVRSLLMLGLPYRTAEPNEPSGGTGRVSRYAWSDLDYHDVIHARLRALLVELRQHTPTARGRGVVDTAPLMEREFAQLAGLGWIGKHTLLINRQAGSWFFLAALLTDAELDYDEPFRADHCGTCRACLDACPTGAFPAPHVLDASRCLSYLTIEHAGPIPRELRPGIGDWLFGCDICQDVCPWNRRAPISSDDAWRPRADENPLELAPLFWLSDDEFRQRFRRTPLWRPKRRGLLRNAAIVLGNQRHRAAFPALVKGLSDDEPVVRGAAAWALGQVGGPEARQALDARLAREVDRMVRDEIIAALQALNPPESPQEFQTGEGAF